MITIALENRSTVVSPVDFMAAVAAAQHQISNEFRAHWGIDAKLVVRYAAPGQWVLRVFDDTDQQGALGYHDDPVGLPTGSVFARTTMNAGLPWQPTLSHELCELLIDPFALSSVQMDAQTFVALEICDACENVTYAAPNGVLVSDFVLPAWFDPTIPGPWSNSGAVPGPFQLLAGGYVGIWSAATGWTQKTGDLLHPKAHQAAAPSARRESRNKNRFRISLFP